jgi:GAF domain-containing protein
MESVFQPDIDAVQRIDAVPKMLNVICRTTGMGFAAVARVTEERWICCAVRDEIEFGLKAGGELRIETTICHEIRQSHKAVVIDHVAQDQAFFGHHTPAMYGFQSYISVPIILSDGTFLGCRVSGALRSAGYIASVFSPGPQWQFRSLFRPGCSDFEWSRPSARPDLERSGCRARKPS